MARVSAAAFDAGLKGEEAASAYAEYMASVAPHAASALKDMAPAMLFAAPLAVVLAAAIAQFHEMKKNKARCAELGARLGAAGRERIRKHFIHSAPAITGSSDGTLST